MNSFPSINEQNRPKGLFEPYVPVFAPRFKDRQNFGLYSANPTNTTNPTNEPEPKSKLNPLLGPDWTPNFTERIDIEANSIGLALSTLNLSKAEYNAMDINQLKDMRRIDCHVSDIYAYNILIHYKQNSRNLSIKEHNSFQHKFNLYGEEKAHAKIYPEMNKFLK